MITRLWSIELAPLLKRLRLFSLRQPYNPRAKALKLEEKTLALSGLQLHKDLHIFDVPINYQGTQLMHTIRCGDDKKETLVLLHGYCGSLVLNYPILKKLSERFNVYCVDLLGLGLSSRPDFNCTTTKDSIDYYIDSLEEWRKAMNIKDFYMGGHSFGGYISAQYAAKYTNTVTGLYLFSPTGLSIELEEDVIHEGTANMSWLKKQFWYAYFHLYTHTFYTTKITPLDLVRNHPLISKVCIRGYIQMLYKTNIRHASLLSNYLLHMYLIPGGSEKAIHYILKPPRLGAFAPLEPLITSHLKLPIYCYYGIEDWVDSTGAKKIAQDTNGTHFKVKWISKSGHQLIMQNPQELCEEVLSTPNHTQSK